MDRVTVRVLRAFMADGARAEPGTIVAVSPAIVADLVVGGKAERAEAPAGAPAVESKQDKAEQPEPKRRGRPAKE